MPHKLFNFFQHVRYCYTNFIYKHGSSPDLELVQHSIGIKSTSVILINVGNQNHIWEPGIPPRNFRVTLLPSGKINLEVIENKESVYRLVYVDQFTFVFSKYRHDIRLRQTADIDFACKTGLLFTMLNNLSSDDIEQQLIARRN